MDNASIMRKDKLGFDGIVGESFRIPIKNPKFLVFTLLTSLPLFLSLLLFEFLFQETLVGSFRTLVSDDSSGSCVGDLCVVTLPSWGPMSSMKRVISNHFHQFAILWFVYLVLVHPLDLLNTILILCHSSALYAGETLQSFSGFWRRPLKDFGCRGPLITSLYAFGLSALVTVGLVSFGMQFYQVLPSWDKYLIPGTEYYDDYYYYPAWVQFLALFIFSLLFGGFFFALLVKYIDWSSIWNLGIAISVLEEKHGDIAIGVAAYISRGSRGRGFLLMLVFLLWKHCLRLLCLYLVWEKTWSRAAATVAQVLGVCSGNLMMWVVILVYYCDCKKRFLEKKIDLEVGKSTEHK